MTSVGTVERTLSRTLGVCVTARTYQEAKDVAAAAARTERHRSRLRDNGAGLNFFVRTAMVGRERQQLAAADDEDAASTTYFEMTERAVGAPGGTGSAEDCDETQEGEPLRPSESQRAGLYTEPPKDAQN